MRNLKRALSLTLASVMLLGMMVVGSSAAAGYSDVADTDNVEAIEVLQAIEVMVGDDNGFRPGDSVNRAEMAVVMAKLLNLDYNYYSATCPFNDVYDWARGYVGACYANGIVSGRGEGIYDPGTTVTAVEAASMMLRALGYFKYQSDYADGFEVATVREGTKVGIFNGVGSNSNTPLTRNQVAQMALNALKTGVVEPDGNTINMTTPDGSVITSKVNYVNVTSNKRFASAISKVQATSIGSTNDGWIVELGERLYDGKLKLNEDELDVFGRPARKWEFDGKFIGAYAKKEIMVKDDVGKVTGLDLYNLLGKSTIDDYTLFVHVDGVDNPAIVRGLTGPDKSNTDYVFNASDLNRNNKAAIGGTGVGVLMQVFVDHEKRDIYVAVINTYLARADKAYDAKKEEASIVIYDLEKDLATGDLARSDEDKTVTMKLGKEDFDEGFLEKIAKNDPFLVQVADGEVQTIQDAEVLSAVSISAFKRNDYVVSGGTQYKHTVTASYKVGDLDIYTSEDNNTTNLKDRTYNIFLDTYGNLIGLEEVEGAKNYVFLAGIDLNGSNLSNRTATANAIFTDGTVDTISINMIKSEWVNGEPTGDGNPLLNTWCTYTKSGDVYTVKEVYDVIDPATGVADRAREPKSTVTGAKNDTKLAQYNQTLLRLDGTAPLKEITLKNGLRLSGGFTTGAYTNVYGDSNSAYITAELGRVRNNNDNYGIIKGVEAVFTGIDGTSITVWENSAAKPEAMNEANKGITTNPVTDLAKVAYGVYTLYNNDGLVIASVVVGEGSSAKDLVYVTSGDLSLEQDNGGARAEGDGKWTWSREVVRNGELTTLTEVGDSVDAISAKNMLRYEWYQVKLDGDGNVISSEPAFSALNGRSIFEANYSSINDRVETSGIDTVLYLTDGGPNANYEDVANGYDYTHTGFTEGDKLEVRGNNTLAVNTKVGSGIYFRSNVHVVLQYWNRNTQETDVMVGEGVDDLKSMVDYVNENNESAKKRYGARPVGENYYVSALIENGAATTIVIYDAYNNYERKDPVTPSTDADLTWVKPGEWQLTVPAGTVVTTPTQIRDWLAKASCTNISMTGSGWTFTYYGTTYAGQTVTVKEKDAPTTWTVKVTGDNIVPVADMKVENGKTVTFTVTAAAGYELVSVGGKAVTPAGSTSATITTNPITADTTIVVVTKLIDDGTDDYVETGRIQWNETTDLVTYKHKVTGEEIMKLEPHKAAEAKMATTVDLDMSKGSRVLLKTSKGVFADLLSMGSYFKLLKPLNMAAIDGTTMAQRENPVTVAAVTGEPTYADNKLNVVLGAPIEGGKLPEKIVIDDTIEATVAWKDDKGADVTGIPAEGADLTKFTYTLALTTVEGKTITGDVTVTTVDSKTYTVKGSDLAGVVNVTDKGVIEGGQAEETTVTLTLKDTAADQNKKLIGADGSLKAEVYDGNNFVKAEMVKTLTDGTTYTAKVTPGAKITLKSADGNTAITGATNGKVIKVDGVNITVADTQKTLTFTMPETDFTLDNKNVADTAEIVIITVKDGVTGTWKLNGETDVALKQGDNEVKTGGAVTITGTGSGTVVLQDQLSKNASALNGTNKVFNTADGSNTTDAISSKTTLRAGIEVEVVAENAAMTIDGAAVTAAGQGEKLYAAVGGKMVFTKDSSTFDGFLANTKGGTALTGGAWTVAKPANAEKATIYGARAVKLDGVTAAYGDSAEKATTALKSGDVVAVNQYVKATAPAGSAAVKYTKNKAIYGGSDKFTSGQITDAGLDLVKATEVGVFAGKVTKWGETKDCANTATDETGLIYVLPNTWLKVDGNDVQNATNSVVPVVYVDDVLSTEYVAVDKAVAFLVGDKRVDVKLGEEEAVDAATQLANTIQNAVAQNNIGTCHAEGNVIYAVGNFHYLGKPFEGETEKQAYRHSVAYELQKFLVSLHSQENGKYSTIRYNGTDYTWGEFTVDGQKSNGYQINGTTSLISVLVDDSKTVFPTYQEGTWTVTLETNGLPFQFVVTISEQHTKPANP